MKKIDRYIAESLNMSPNMLTSIFLTACFCIPNGVAVVVQLIRDKGKRAAAEELLNSLNRSQKEAIKKLNKLDLDKYPYTKKLMHLIMKGSNIEDVMTQYWVVVHSKEIGNPIIYKNIENITTGYIRSMKADKDRRIKWLISPSTFLSMIKWTKTFAKK